VAGREPGIPEPLPDLRLIERDEDGVARPMLVWDAGPGWRMISSGSVGGGIGPRAWWLNAGVARDYARTDLRVHLDELAAVAGVTGPGVGMLTAADVRGWTRADDGGVAVAATVGLGVPVLAAATPERIAGEVVRAVGTINVLAVVPVPLADAALVNAVLTLTEAKTQALVEHGVPGTGTASDAVCIACPAGTAGRPAEPFCGPRSFWGARLARAVHAAVGDGTAAWLARTR
jgi:adenosylcobinamide amidohydrolase